MSTCWTPKDHRYDGTCDATQKVDPHYPTMPDYIKVYDLAVRNSGWARWQKKLWRKARRGVERWGYPVVYLEKGLVPGDYLPGGITLYWHLDGTVNSYGGFGLYPLSPPSTADYDKAAWRDAKGMAAIHGLEVRRAFSARVTGRLAGVICHEVGHALGFGHGGSGIMRSAVMAPYYPSLEDIGYLTEYWGIA